MKIQTSAIFYFCIGNICILVAGQCQVTLQQKFGKVQGNGLLSITPSGNLFCSFLSIPYALPPTGILRFEPPQPMDLSTNSIFWDFTVQSPNCIQNPLFTNLASGQEDCLYLNVYTKPANPTKTENLKPVIVAIFGSWFHSGSAYDNGVNRPDFLIDEDVVVVTFNYRLGILGFLYREGEGIVGNNGLRDQQEVFKWVQKNIVSFGGDPKRVTLMGWSSGSASIAYHLQAPTSRGLFHGAIMLSGTNFNPWAYLRNTEQCIRALCQSLRISCTRGGLKNILKQIPANIFATESFNYNTTVSWFGELFPCFVPTAEGSYSTWRTPIIRDKQPRLIAQPLLSDVPIIIGHTVAEQWQYYNVNRDTLTERWNYSYPNIKNHIINPLRQYLLSGTKELGNPSKQILVHAAITHGVKQFADYHSTKATSNTFLYRFSHKNNSNDIGAFHGDGLQYIFVQNNPNNLWTYEDYIIRDRIIRYITNFAKFGDPTPTLDSVITTQWYPYCDNGLRMEISQDSKMVEDIKEDTYYRWEAISQCLEFNICRKFFKFKSEWFAFEKFYNTE